MNSPHELAIGVSQEGIEIGKGDVVLVDVLTRKAQNLKPILMANATASPGKLTCKENQALKATMSRARFVAMDFFCFVHFHPYDQRSLWSLSFGTKACKQHPLSYQFSVSFPNSTSTAVLLRQPICSGNSTSTAEPTASTVSSLLSATAAA